MRAPLKSDGVGPSKLSAAGASPEAAYRFLATIANPQPTVRQGTFGLLLRRLKDSVCLLRGSPNAIPGVFLLQRNSAESQTAQEGKCPMPTYVTLYKWTDQAVKDAKNAPARFQASRKLIESMGGKLLGVYVTMGEYDVVTLAEAPSDEVACNVALSIASKGNVKSTTMRAFTEGEFGEIVKKLP